MALVDVPDVYFPDWPTGVGTGPSLTGTPIVVDADGEGIAMIFQAPFTGSMTGFTVRTGTLTAGDAGTLGQLESVSTASTPAMPNGIIAAGRSATVNVNASNTVYTFTFTTPYAATQGELLAVTVTRPTAGSLNTQFNTFGDEVNANTIFPFASNNAGAGWIASANASPMIAIAYGAAYYPVRGSFPYSAITTNTFNSGSTPDVIGNRWTPTFACRVKGIWLWADLDGPSQIKFYDTDGVTVLAQCTVLANQRPVATPGIVFLPFDDALGPPNVTPTVGATYWIGIEPSSVTSMTCYSVSVSAAAVMDMFGLGASMIFDSSKNPSGTGSWTGVNAAQRTLMGVIVNQLDNGVSSGGGGGARFQSISGGGVN